MKKAMVHVAARWIAAIGVVALSGAPTQAEAQFRNPNQPVEDQFSFLARGLRAEYITRNAGQDLDQIQFLPIGSRNPTHIIACIEEQLACLSPGCSAPFEFGDKLTPSVQRITIKRGPDFGKVETIVRGMTICDGIRTTPWGTVLATEEDFASDTGSVYEILDPMTTDEFTVLRRNGGGAPADIVDQNGQDASNRIVKRTSLPVIRYEGFIVDETGVIIAGDEERPGSYRPDSDGGAIFKYIPDTLRTPGSGNISRLSQSPLAGTGKTYAAQVTCTGGIQFGQGCEVGEFNWVLLAPQAAETGDDTGMNRIGREAANDAGATAFYRPEDMHRDENFAGPGVRFCFANTGSTSSDQFGEVICAIDFDIDGVNPSGDDGTMNRLLEGDEDLNQPDNLEFQPGSGNLYVIEDNPNGDVWACLDDGGDRDLKSDGCIRVFTLADPSAEPTGFIFLPDGDSAIFNIQHSDDDNVPLFDDFLTDDLVLVSGFRRTRSSDFGRNTELNLFIQSRRLFGFQAEFPFSDDD